MKLVSWNLNGLAACRRKGFLRFLAGTAPDIFCCQEIKTKCPLHTPGYFQYWNPAKRKGYAGTLVLARREPLSFALGFGVEERVVFRRAIHHQSGLLVPRDLLEKKLPDAAVQECNNFFRYVRKKYGF